MTAAQELWRIASRVGTDPLLGAARYRFLFDGLYLAGSGAHPGGGITGGPGANAAKKILKDL